MAFNRREVEELLVACRRRCCICQRFCGTKIETDHIEPTAKGGTDQIENAIPVCFECHAQIHTYNVAHPRGRMFTPGELRGHKEQWLRVCSSHPEIFRATRCDGDVGPLQALVDELEYNRAVASQQNQHGAVFVDRQFHRAIQEGMVALLENDLRLAIVNAYVATSRANQLIVGEARQSVKDMFSGFKQKPVNEALSAAGQLIDRAQDLLIRFLGSEAQAAS